jgi:hypothetical protein
MALMDIEMNRNEEHIVLAFHHPSRRPDTEFAVA